MGVLSKVPSTFLDLFFPKVCVCCGSAFSQGLSNVLCSVCFDRIEPYRSPVCERCGISLPERAFEGVGEPRCLDCGEMPSHLDTVRSLGPYEGALRLAHHAFKFQGMEHLAIPLAHKITIPIAGSFWKEVQALIPVPMNPEKERERGYNPSALLAHQISIGTDIPVLPLIQKTRSNVSQRTLSREERLKNPRGAFEVIALAGVERVVLVDDVLTTGATLEECAKVLKTAGVRWVGAVVWGRTPRHGNDRAGN